ncbi:hypothetical protein R83H12_02394 [Fibrobacteria bacterium R8-3-H12]
MTVEELTKLKVTKDGAIEIVLVGVAGVIGLVGVVRSENVSRG